MLVLDVLYLPILSATAQVILPEKVSFEPNQYLHVLPMTSQWTDIFLFHDSFIDNCTSVSRTPSCQTLCSGQDIIKVKFDHSFDYLNDSIIPLIFLLFYVLFCVALGLPIIWSFVISSNKKLLSKINVYGKTVDDKWQSSLVGSNQLGLTYLLNSGMTEQVGQ